MHLNLSSSLGRSRLVASAPPPPLPSPSKSRLRFYGATSVLGGSNYQMGRLIHNVTIDGSGNSSISVSKTNTTNDVDISNFNNTGTVSVPFANNFVIRAIGSRSGVDSAIQGGSTEDSIGINGGNPGKLDVAAGNETENITWEIVNLNPILVFTLKSISVIQANFVPVNQKPSMVLTDFSSVEVDYTVQLGGTNVVTFDSFGTQDVTIQGIGVGTAGSFTTGIRGADNTGYGIYAIDFDVTAPV